MRLSKKLITTVAGVAVVLLVNVVGLSEETASQITTALIAVISTYNIGQGIADHGKEAVRAQKEIPTSESTN